MEYALLGILLIIVYELLFRKATHKLLIRLHSLLLVIGAYIANYWRKILRAVIQLIIDFGLFWFIFLWQDGQIATDIGSGLSQFGNWCATAAGDVGSFFAELWQWFLGQVPASIETPLGLSFIWCFAICAIFAIAGLITALRFSHDYDEISLSWFPKLALSLVITALYTYACYWMCHLLMRIHFTPVWLAWVIKILTTLISGGIVFVVAALIFVVMLNVFDLLRYITTKE